VSWIEIAGYVASALVFSTFYMKTMIPLRCAAIASNVAFITYGYFGHLRPVLLLHVLLLPLNVVRLVQMRRLIAAIQEASRGDLSFASMAPYMTSERFGGGQVLFRQGDPADKLYVLCSGQIVVPELGTSLTGQGTLIGEIGIFAPSGRRTASAIAQRETQVLTLTADKVLQLYYQNPAFGLHLLRLVVRRLLDAPVPLSAGGDPRRRAPCDDIPSA
jgi:hypothetical protein